MGYDLSGRLVVGIASSALFDLTESDRVFRTEGEAAYRAYQEEHVDDALDPGTAFGFVRRLLALNDLSPSPDDPLVEVVVMSRNSPETGLRVMRSVRHHGLDITRAVFRQGRTPYEFIRPLHMDLFLSADEESVRAAVDQGLPAGYVLDPTFADEPGDDLRIAFDFDGVLADDSSEREFRDDDLDAYRRREAELAHVPLAGGPLRDLLVALHRIQAVERRRHAAEPGYAPRVHVALVTARSAPAHERAVATLKSWGVDVDDAFFLGGIDKDSVLEVLRPHMFFDDQRGNVDAARRVAPSVHVPYGALNRVASSPEPASPDVLAPPAPLPVPGVVRVSAVARAARPALDASAEPVGDGAASDDQAVPGTTTVAATGTRELPVLHRVPELTVLGRSQPEDAEPGEGSRRARRAEAREDGSGAAAVGSESTPGAGGSVGGSGGVEDVVALPTPKPLPVRTSSFARHR
ncbi:5'-nucleotidase [Cellulosimicrobium terreum]|nr:5'-nucleotidase [Cellulosimicrobium terreum]